LRPSHRGVRPKGKHLPLQRSASVDFHQRATHTGHACDGRGFVVMKDQSPSADRDTGHPIHAVRLPGFVSDEDLGLGDVIKRVTSAVGIKPCSGCEHRAEALNRWLAFSGRRSSSDQARG
jgi:hypothetical protein